MAFGFHVTTIPIQQRDPQRLHEIFTPYRMGSGGFRTRTCPAAPDGAPLQAKFGDDIRTMEAALYNSIEQMSEVGHVRLLD